MLDPNSPVPIFRQIADKIRGDVASGVYRSGERIPSIRQTSALLLINVNTVQRAYEQLEREGLIINKRGVGMIVSPQSERVAKGGVEEDVTSTFVQAIAMARGAKLSRTAVDHLYREAWGQLVQRNDNEPASR